MKKYQITYYETYEVEAKNEDDAIDMADKLLEDNKEAEAKKWNYKIDIIN